jgi:hypothetical protein
MKNACQIPVNSRSKKITIDDKYNWQCEIIHS